MTTDTNTDQSPETPAPADVLSITGSAEELRAECRRCVRRP
jgi:hypothetical protein